MTNDKLLTIVAAHGAREGAADYFDRALDVAHRREVPEWAWPFVNADEAYINAVGADEIRREIGVEAPWDDIAETWCAAFRRGYKAARATT